MTLIKHKVYIRNSLVLTPSYEPQGTCEGLSASSWQNPQTAPPVL